MEPVLQQQIMALLHYALKPGGHLWLGKSETASASRALFEVEDARHKIFARRPGASAAGLSFRPATGGGRGCIDFVLSPEDIARKIMRIAGGQA